MILFLLIWEIFIHIFGIASYLLPSPLLVLKDIISNFVFIANNTKITIIEAGIGFILANTLAFFLAILFSYSKFIENGLYPYAIALKTTPIVAMAPILVLWLGTGIYSKIAASSLICFFPMLVNASKGLRDVEEETLDLFESFGASKIQIFSKLKLPNSSPYIFSALKISSSLSVIGAIVGEFVGADKGLGYLIIYASYHLEMDRMFSAIIASALIGIAFFVIISIIESRILHWRSFEQQQ